MAESTSERQPMPLHQINNRLAIIIGLCDLLLLSTPQAESRFADLQEIRNASEQILQLLPKQSSSVI